MRSFVLAAIAALSTTACAQLPQQTQASHLAVPTPAAPQPVSILATTLCNKLIGLVVVDSEGNLHPVPIEGMTPKEVHQIVSTVPAEKVLAAAVPCPGQET
jgi:hypothetical protein